MRMDARLIRGLGTGVVTLFLAGGAVVAAGSLTSSGTDDPVPAVVETSGPTETADATAEATETAEPTADATDEPTADPTDEPTADPTAEATDDATAEPRETAEPAAVLFFFCIFRTLSTASTCAWSVRRPRRFAVARGSKSSATERDVAALREALRTGEETRRFGRP